MRRAEPEYPMFKPRRMSSSVPAKSLDGLSRSLPAESSQRHAAAAQRHAFLLEQDALGHHAAHRPAAADLSPRVHHALPAQPRGTPGQRAPPHARAPRPAEPRGDLAVGRNLSPRNPGHLAPPPPLELDHVPPPNWSS